VIDASPVLIPWVKLAKDLRVVGEFRFLQVAKAHPTVGKVRPRPRTLNPRTGARSGRLPSLLSESLAQGGCRSRRRPTPQGDSGMSMLEYLHSPHRMFRARTTLGDNRAAERYMAQRALSTPPWWWSRPGCMKGAVGAPQRSFGPDFLRFFNTVNHRRNGPLLNVGGSCHRVYRRPLAKAPQTHKR